MVERKGELIRGENLRLRGQDAIHSGCEVIDCTMHIADPCEVFLFCSSFRRTTIEVAKTCKRHWDGCFFDSCKFKGKYYDCQFGTDSDQCSRKAGFRNCDFSEATLNLCSFYNCTRDDLRLPGWPHITIFQPVKNADDFAELAVDPLLARINQSMYNSSPREVGIIYHLPTYLRTARKGIIQVWEIDKLFAKAKSQPIPPEPVFSLENMRKLLQTKPYVFM